MTKLCGIYLLTHIATGRKYVGQSVDIQKRWREHSRCYSDARLGKSIKQYGWHAFNAEIVELCEFSRLNELELFHITLQDCVFPRGFNLAKGGGNSLHHPESIAKMSASQTGVMHTAETRQKIATACKERMTETEKARLSAILKGRERSPGATAKTAAAHIGMKRSTESKEKMRLAKLGKKQSAEHIASRLATRKEHPPKKPAPFREEHRARISASGKGRAVSQKTIEKRKATRAANKLLRNNTTIATTGDLLA